MADQFRFCCLNYQGIRQTKNIKTAHCAPAKEPKIPKYIISFSF